MVDIWRQTINSKSYGFLWSNSYNHAWPWFPLSIARASHALPFFGLRVGHPWKGLKDLKKIQNKKTYSQFGRYWRFLCHFSHIRVWVEWNRDVTGIVHKSTVTPKLWVNFLFWSFFSPSGYRSHPWENYRCLFSCIFLRPILGRVIRN
jgi:hypothetical protein